MKLQIPDNIFEHTDSEDEYSKYSDEENEEQFVHSRIIEDPSDTCLKRLLQLYDNHHNMSSQE